MSEDLLEEIERLASPYLEACGLMLVDLTLKRRGKRSVLFFYVDRPGGAGIEECARFSRMMGDALDVADLIPEGYDLEVSSPGADRELRKDREIRWAIGKPVRCWTRAPIEGATEFHGRLLDASDSWLAVEEVSGRSVKLPRELVAKVRLAFEFPWRSKDRPELASLKGSGGGVL